MSCLDSLGDRLRIKEVVLVGLHKRLHELRCDQPNVMPLFAQRTAQKVRARAGLQADQ
jgi:hypothetical protein